EGTQAFRVVPDQTPDHCLDLMSDTIVPRIEKDFHVLQRSRGLDRFFVAADLHGRDVTLEADPVRCDLSGDQDRALILAEHFEPIHPPTERPSQSFEREQPWSAAEFGDQDLGVEICDTIDQARMTYHLRQKYEK